MRTAKFISLKALLIFCALHGLQPVYGGEAWQTEIIDPDGGGKYSTLLFDKAGNGHVSYIDETTHELKYAFWDQRLRKWFAMKVDDRATGFPSMTLDSQERPRISVLNYGASRVKYAQWKDNTWKVQELGTGASLMEYHTSIVLDKEDRPFISYYEVLRPGSNDYVLHLRTIRWADDHWQINTVDSLSGSGKFNYLGVSPDGHISIAYANVKYEHASLRYARWNGKAWVPEILQGAEGRNNVHSVALAVGQDGTPHIVYSDLERRAIRYATIVGGNWQLLSIAGLAREAFPDRHGITLDSKGNPYMTFVDMGPGVLKLLFRRGNDWMSEVVEGRVTGFTSAIQVVNGEIVITTYDAETNSLKCYRRPVEPGAVATAPVSARR